MKISGRLLILFLLLASPVFAQDKDITLFGGVQLPGKITLSNAAEQGSSGVSDIIDDPANVGVFGARFGHGEVIGGEHTIAYAPNFLDSNSRAFIYNSNILIQAPLPLVKPYGTVGAGTIISWGNGAGDLGGKFAFNYGGGIKIMPVSGVGIRADIRGYMVPRVQDQTLNIAEVTLGIVFGF